jgi:hypothetical protein
MSLDKTVFSIKMMVSRKQRKRGGAGKPVPRVNILKTGEKNVEAIPIQPFSTLA